MTVKVRNPLVVLFLLLVWLLVGCRTTKPTEASELLENNDSGRLEILNASHPETNNPTAVRATSETPMSFGRNNILETEAGWHAYFYNNVSWQGAAQHFKVTNSIAKDDANNEFNLDSSRYFANNRQFNFDFGGSQPPFPLYGLTSDNFSMRLGKMFNVTDWVKIRFTGGSDDGARILLYKWQPQTSSWKLVNDEIWKDNMFRSYCRAPAGIHSFFRVEIEYPPCETSLITPENQIYYQFDNGYYYVMVEYFESTGNARVGLEMVPYQAPVNPPAPNYCWQTTFYNTTNFTGEQVAGQQDCEGDFKKIWSGSSTPAPNITQVDGFSGVFQKLFRAPVKGTMLFKAHGDDVLKLYFGPSYEDPELWDRKGDINNPWWVLMTLSGQSPEGSFKTFRIEQPELEYRIFAKFIETGGDAIAFICYQFIPDGQNIPYDLKCRDQ